MKSQVLSIEQMQYLQELGVDTSKASMIWCQMEGQEDFVEPIEDYSFWVDEVFKTHAFTLQDILEMLPSFIYSFPYEDKERYDVHYLKIEKLTSEWVIAYTDKIIVQSNLLTCAYEVLCWCAENGYIGGEK